MTTHIRLALWAFQILWGFKTIWIFDRLRLWRKSINLYVLFLEVTDHIRPTDQLRRAMICAFLSAVYDYETDWEGGRDGIFKQLSERYIKTKATRDMAMNLLSADKDHTLSRDGLERGSVAFQFYRLVINSDWLRRYTETEINQFGRRLQIIDDVLDLRRDRIAADNNCLLLANQAECHAAELAVFLDSEFLQKLKENSLVYRLLDRKVRAKFARFTTQPATLPQLFRSGRPLTAVYAFLLTWIGFSFYADTPWWVLAGTAIAYSGLTMGAMVFNDWYDREHDRKKGYVFASNHPKELIRYWWLLNGLVTLSLGLIWWWDQWLALYCLAAGITSVLYSYTRRLYLLNNLLVAVCAGSPALCGMIYHRQPTLAAITTYLAFTLLILWHEIYKDCEDNSIDIGYKATLPTTIGHVLTLAHLIGLMVIPTAALVIHPNYWVRILACLAMPILAFQQGLTLFHPKKIMRPKLTLRLTIAGLLVILLVS